MSKISFTWDTNKAKSNKNKHGIDFDEAKSVFYDDNALFQTISMMKKDLYY
jgi:uncharacterized protein